MSTEYENRFEKLIEALRLLASDYDIQVSAFPDYVHIPDEVALIFDEVWPYVQDLLDRGFINEDQHVKLTELDKMLTSMNDDKRLWSLGQLRSAPEWRVVRDLATSILDSFGKCGGKANLSWVRYVPGKPS